MAIVDENDLRYTMDSRRVIELVKRRLGESLDQIAVKRTLDSGRNVVTAEDVLSSVTEALFGLAEQTAKADDGH